MRKTTDQPMFRFTMSGVEPADAVKLLKVRVEAMASGRVFVRPHLRVNPWWDRWNDEEKAKHLECYAKRVAKQAAASVKRRD